MILSKNKIGLFFKFVMEKSETPSSVKVAETYFTWNLERNKYRKRFVYKIYYYVYH